MENKNHWVGVGSPACSQLSFMSKSFNFWKGIGFEGMLSQPFSSKISLHPKTEPWENPAKPPLTFTHILTHEPALPRVKKLFRA